MRSMSLASRFLVTLVVTAVLPLLVYGWFSLHAMRAQIDEQVVRVFLPQLAADHAQKIDAHLERTHQACAIVREIARRPLDSDSKQLGAELAAFAEQVELVPDLLDNYLDLLLLADADGKVLWWADGQRLDPGTHLRRAALIPASVADKAWFREARRQRGVELVPWGRSELLHRGLDYRSMDPGSHHVGLALAVPQAGERTGVLFALVRWPEVQQVLDDARAVLAQRANLGSARVLLVDRGGTIVGHTDRARYGQPLTSQVLARQVARCEQPERGVYRAADGAAWRVGLAPCTGPAARAFVVTVAVPEAQLFAATDAFERVLLVAIAVTLLVLGTWSLVASRAITAPVQRLVAAARRIAAGDLAVTVAPRGGPELGELAGAFNQMAAQLAVGRERLAAAQREQAWAEMARQVAHEVRNPLQPMRMAAQLLQRARAEHDPRADLVAERLARTVLEQTETLDRIASDFRAFAGVAPAQRASVRADDWLVGLGEHLTGLFVGKPVAITCEPGAGDARVAIDARAVARVFVNLVQNAHEASPAGVAVRLSTAASGEHVVVTVADDGPGVPDAARARLFEPYFTTKSAGTGLGLAICRRLVEAHDGVIRLAESGPGRTVFEVVLPRSPG